MRVSSEVMRRQHDIVITNVPGPQTPVYAGGERLVASYPVLPLEPGHLLAIGVTSYYGEVFVGLTGDRDALSDLDVLANCVRDAVEELRDTTLRAGGFRQPTRKASAAAKRAAAKKAAARQDAVRRAAGQRRAAVRSLANRAVELRAAAQQAALNSVNSVNAATTKAAAGSADASPTEQVPAKKTAATKAPAKKTADEGAREEGGPEEDCDEGAGQEGGHHEGGRAEDARQGGREEGADEPGAASRTARMSRLVYLPASPALAARLRAGEAAGPWARTHRQPRSSSRPRRAGHRTGRRRAAVRRPERCRRSRSSSIRERPIRGWCWPPRWLMPIWSISIGPNRAR